MGRNSPLNQPSGYSAHGGYSLEDSFNPTNNMPATGRAAGIAMSVPVAAAGAMAGYRFANAALPTNAAIMRLALGYGRFVPYIGAAISVAVLAWMVAQQLRNWSPSTGGFDPTLAPPAGWAWTHGPCNPLSVMSSSAGACSGAVLPYIPGLSPLPGVRIWWDKPQYYHPTTGVPYSVFAGRMARTTGTVPGRPGNVPLPPLTPVRPSIGSMPAAVNLGRTAVADGNPVLPGMIPAALAPLVSMVGAEAAPSDNPWHWPMALSPLLGSIGRSVPYTQGPTREDDAPLAPPVTGVPTTVIPVTLGPTRAQRAATSLVKPVARVRAKGPEKKFTNNSGPGKGWINLQRYLASVSELGDMIDVFYYSLPKWAQTGSTRAGKWAAIMENWQYIDPWIALQNLVLETSHDVAYAHGVAGIKRSVHNTLDNTGLLHGVSQLAYGVRF